MKIMKLMLVAFGILVIVSCGGRTKDAELAQMHLQMGLGHISLGNYPAALKEMLKAQELDPNDVAIENNLGIAYFLRSRPEEAEKHLLRALEINPQYTEARNNLGRIYIERGKYALAINELNKVLEDLTYQYPEKAYLNLGIAYFSKGDYKSAKKFLLESLRIKRDNCMAYSYYGRSLYEMKEYGDAAKELDQAALYCKASAFDEPHYYSALSYQKLGKRAEAVARLEEIIKLYPDGKYREKAKQALNGNKQ